MKHCPSCKTNYADDTLQFCLQDGTQLVDLTADAAAAPTIAYSEQETVVRNKPPERVVPLGTPNFQVENWQTNPGGQTADYPTAPKRSNTLAAVLLTAAVMLLLFITGVGAWLYLRNGREVAVKVNTDSPANRPSNVNSANNQNSNANSPTPSPTPVPKPTLDAKQLKAAAEDVKDVVDDWKSALENLDMETHLAQYADTVDYYKGGRVGIEKVRADKQRAFQMYDSIDVNIKNLKITPDDSGAKAVAVFDKEWTFEGEEKYSAGKVQQQLTLDKINGRWLITGEKDLKVYYVEK